MESILRGRCSDSELTIYSTTSKQSRSLNRILTFAENLFGQAKQSSSGETRLLLNRKRPRRYYSSSRRHQMPVSLRPLVRGRATDTCPRGRPVPVRKWNRCAKRRRPRAQTRSCRVSHAYT
jgi:hypothetical protein